MLAPALGLVVKPLAFALASAPMLIDATRNDTIENSDNAVLLAAGLATLAGSNYLGLQGFPLPGLFACALVVVAALLGWWFGGLGGGAAKFFIALLPWFTSSEYLTVVAIGMLTYGVGLKLLRPRRAHSIAPVIFLVGLVVLTVPLLNAGW